MKIVGRRKLNDVIAYTDATFNCKTKIKLV